MEIAGYTVQQKIGAGGMATAYLARQDSLGRLVVLKVLHTDRRKNPLDFERFMNEARIVASLNHPHVITIYDIGVCDDAAYMSMEYVEGGDLRKRMRAVITPFGALDILIAVGSGLSVAHKKGIVHRDVKPANILFRKDGTPLLSDFGIAKQLTTDLDLTQTGIVLGSPNYMAPEQAEPGSIDGRADIYALGVILYEMLTGVKPYQSDSVLDVIMQHKRAPIPLLPSGLDQFQPLINLMLAKNRKDRFRDADSLLHHVRHMMQSGIIKTSTQAKLTPDVDVSGEHTLSLDNGRIIELPVRTSSRRSVHALGGLLAVAVAGYAGLFYAQARVDRDAGPRHDPELQSLAVDVDRNLLGDARATSPVATSVSVDPGSAEVVKALAWLAKKSLDDYRLTHPPQDNAYYYYSRLLEIEPGNVPARKGLLAIGERFAFLAERELANNNYDRAKGYVAIGLQFAPENDTLLALKSLAQRPHGGLADTLAKFFR
ncbi:MAG: serine/threonine-protein kinase [Chromatiales bacterium]